MGRAAKIAVTVIIVLVVLGVLVGLYEEYEAARSLSVEPRVYAVPTPTVELVVKNDSPYGFEVEDLAMNVLVEGARVAEVTRHVLYVPPHGSEVEISPESLEVALRAVGAALSKGEIAATVDGKADIPIKLFGIVRVGSVTLPFHETRHVLVYPPK